MTKTDFFALHVRSTYISLFFTPAIITSLVVMPLVKILVWCSLGEIYFDLSQKQTNILYITLFFLKGFVKITFASQHRVTLTVLMRRKIQTKQTYQTL